MRKFVICIFFFVPVILYGQNVGIGNTTPNTRLHITGGTSASLSSGSGYFLLGNTNSTNLVMDNTGLQARNNGARAPLFLNQDNGDVIMPGGLFSNVGIGTSAPDAALHIADVTNVTLSSGSGVLVLGNMAANNLVFDHFQIQARNNGVAGDLVLNQHGGDIQLGLVGAGNVGIRTGNPEERLTIASGNIKLNSSDKGIMLNAADQPFITRGFDAFTSGTYNGLGRWGMFMEPFRLTFGIPNIVGRAFEFSTYEANSTANPVLTIDRIGQVKRPATNNIDLLPVALGTVNFSGGTLNVINGTGNFTVQRIGSGDYFVTITGHPYTMLDYTAIVTSYSSDPVNFPCFATVKEESGGRLGVYLVNDAGNTQDGGFHFVLYKSY